MSGLDKINFTKRVLEEIAPPGEGRLYFRDSKTRGLLLTVYPTGRKIFSLYRKVDGRPERMMIGPFPDWSVERARGKAGELSGQIAKGDNPAESRRSVRGEWTLGQLFEKYLEKHAKPRKKTWKDDERAMQLYLDWDSGTGWKRRKLSSIRRADIEALHIGVGEDHGHYMANRLLALLSAIFNRARNWGWTGQNPAMGVTKFKEQSRERFLQADELPRFFKALDAKETSSDFRDYVKLSLWTGARRANVLAMRWAEIDLEGARWNIPDTKSGEPHVVALSLEAMQILKRRKHQADKHQADSEWVLPSRAARKSKSGHWEEPKLAWKDLLERAKITNLRIHDLRRTLGSWQAASGASLPLIGKALGHKNTSTTAIYARLSLDPVRESVQAATKAMLAASKVKRG